MDGQAHSAVVLVPISVIHDFPIFSPNPPSEAFLETLIYAGSTDISCQFCNRYHFSSEYQAEEPENETYEELVQKASTMPGGPYIVHGASMVSWGMLDDKQYVVDCPCNAGVFYERLFWEHLSFIAAYSRVRAKAALVEARATLQTARSIVVS